jgi:hypothetical protein
MNPATIIVILISLAIFNYIVNNLNHTIINIYKKPIFKIIFLFGIYYYGDINIYITMLYAIFYIYLGQKIQEKELLYKI